VPVQPQGMFQRADQGGPLLTLDSSASISGDFPAYFG
jgi:hypothetical protein